MFQLWFSPAPPADYREGHAIAAASPFFALHAYLRAHGVLIQPPQEGLFLTSAAHTDEHIEQTLAVAADAMEAVAAAVERGEVGAKGGLR
jgi:glutamate-1-semialdehyde aminotransferase